MLTFYLFIYFKDSCGFHFAFLFLPGNKNQVEDLEEQLRIISLQRKMAEKATADVLSILESRGMGDTHEAVDSESDHETNRESTEGYGESTEGNGSIVSKRLIDSSSDHDCSPVGHRSLSWKGRCDFERSRETDRNQFTKKHRVSSIGSSSPKQHLGKSCRQIRRREARLVRSHLCLTLPRFAIHYDMHAYNY